MLLCDRSSDVCSSDLVQALCIVSDVYQNRYLPGSQSFRQVIILVIVCFFPALKQITAPKEEKWSPRKPC
jgi:hypothetical protein